MSDFVIVVDMQRDFVRASGALPVPDAEAIVGPMQSWLAGLRPYQVAGILFTFDTHDPAAYAGSAEGQMFPVHCVRETAGWEIAIDRTGIDPAIPVFHLEKGVFDMWEEDDVLIHEESEPGRTTDRDQFFRNLQAAGITSITVVGVAADYCVRWAMDGLVARGFRVTTSSELTRGIERGIVRVASEDFADAIEVA